MYHRFNNSYFIAEDKVNGWGNRTYFTYYSEFNRKYAITPYIEASVLSILCIFSTVANSIIFMTLTCNRSLRTVTNFFICNLAVSDMLFTMSGPIIGACRITQSWTMGHCACIMIVYMEFVSGSVSIWTMVMISVERFICIVKCSTSTFTRRIAVFVILVIWIVALLFYSPILISFHVKTFPFGNSTVKICTIEWPKMDTFRISLIFTSSIVLVYFFTPFIFLVHNYVRIFFKFWKTRQIAKRTRTQPDPTWPTARLHIQKIRDARDLKVIKIVFGLVIIFAIMWMPIFTVFIIILVDNALNDMKLGSYIFIIGVCISMGNACVNPILYGVMNEQVKTILVSCFKRKPLSSDMGHNRQLVRPHSLYSIEPAH